MQNNSNKKQEYELEKQEKEIRKSEQARKGKIGKIILGLIIFLIIVGFIFAAIKFSGDSTPSQTLPIDAIVSSDRIKGNPIAKVILIEYSDFQCPACAVYAPIVKQIAEDFQDKAVFAYRHFPLSQHKNAKLAALVSEAAGQQEKFWEMHDKIFENQKEWAENNAPKAEEIFIKYAEELKLDIDKFKNDLKSKELKEKIDNDLNSGIKASVNSTPTFFLNGKKIQPGSYEEFKQVILSQIDSQIDKQ